MEEQSLFQEEGGSSILTSPLQLWFRRIVRSDSANRIFEKEHYAHRAVPISLAFGAYRNDGLKRLVGAISFGKPASPSLCDGCCGKENSERIYELNRLWMSQEAPRNSESRFIGWTLRILKKIRPDWILVSYADTDQKHLGTVYQATGWIYTGITKENTDWSCGDGKHSRHAVIGGDGYFKVKRSKKHRYFYFFKKEDVRHLKYKILPYPK